MRSVAAYPWKRALAWLAFLAPFFFASYGFATWLSSQRNDVGVVLFAWERHIPFLPWTILPYWMIDALYGVSLFLRPNRRALDRHAQRLLLAQLVAISCFVLFPLRFSLERPPVEGFFGELFLLLGQFDKPFNQAPSLHIALMVLLWKVYLDDLPRAWRWPVHLTFALIGLSVLTTWQHHFIDVPTGLLLGFGCLWLLPDGRMSPIFSAPLRPSHAHLRIASYYFLGAMAMTALASLGGAWLWSVWPALALFMVAIAYLRLGVSVFQKQPSGRLSVAAQALLAPYLVGAWLNARLWTSFQPPTAELVQGLWLGRLPQSNRGQPVPDAVLDLSAELPCVVAGKIYINQPWLDLVPPSTDQMDAAVGALESLHGKRVLVCCALGLSRSALVGAAWLLTRGLADTPELALAQVRQCKPNVVLQDGHLVALSAWWHRSCTQSASVIDAG